MLDVEDKIFKEVLKFINSHKGKIKILFQKEEKEYELWTEDDLHSIGKVGLNSKSFDDDKDYEQW